MDKKAIEMEFGLVKFISDRVIEATNGVRYFINKAFMISDSSHYIQYKTI